MKRLSISLHIEFGRDPDDDREAQTTPASIERADPTPDERAEMDSRTIGFRAAKDRK